MPPEESVQVPYSQPIQRVPLDGQQALINEICELHPPGYSSYHYFDSEQLEVNGEHLVPIWRHGVMLPNIFFIQDHIDEIPFPNGRMLCCTKDPFWFKLVHDFIHTSEGVALFADMLWLEWQHKSSHPMKEAIQLCIALYELKSSARNVNFY